MVHTCHWGAQNRPLTPPSKHTELCDEWAAATLARLDRDGALVALLALAGRSTVSQAALLDGWAADFLAEHPASVTVVHLACALDSRAWRLRLRGPGILWVDADMPPIITLRRRLFPNPPPLGPGGEYRALAIDAHSPDWLDSIPDDRPTLVIMEGLAMYLAPATAEALLPATITSAVACVAVTVLALVPYVPFGPWLLATLARLPPTAVTALHPALRLLRSPGRRKAGLSVSDS